MTKKQKVLVVDDEQNICELLRLYLEKEGFEVSIANDGQEALDKIRTENPSLVLLDIMIPKVDGWQVCRRVREAGNNCPIIMLTAKGETFDKITGLELGADDYVVKPFDTKEVIARIKAVLRRSDDPASQDEVVMTASRSTSPITSCASAARWSIPRPRSWSCSIIWPKTPAASSAAISSSTRSGALSITATAAPSMSTSSVCAKSWRACPTSGSSRRSGASATNLT